MSNPNIGGAIVDVDCRTDSAKVVIDGHEHNVNHILENGLSFTMTDAEAAVVTVQFYAQEVRWIAPDGSVLTKKPGKPASIYRGSDAEYLAAARADVEAEATRREAGQ